MIEQVIRSLVKMRGASRKPLTHRIPTVPRYNTKVVLFALLTTLALASGARGQRFRAAQVSGSVRDANGVPQRGALVKVVTAATVLRGSAYTDLHGRYTIRSLTPGTYDVRVAVPSHVRAAHTSLKLHAGMRAIVDLTLLSLSDAATWLPAEHRSAEEPSDDWQWTLRSATNRPILRLAGEDERGGSSSIEHVPAGGEDTLRIAISNDTGRFGSDGPGQSVQRSHTRKDSSMVSVGIHLHEPRADGERWRLSSQLTAEVEGGPRSISKSRSQISLESRPQFVAGSQGSGLQSLRVGRADRIQLGDLVVLDVGSTMDLSHAADYLVWARPFLRMELHPAHKLRFGYGFASSKDAQSYDELDSLRENGAGIVVAGDTLRQASQLHQQLYLEDGESGNLFRVSFYRASPGTAVVTGVLASAPEPSEPSAPPMQVRGLEGIMSDSSSGTFRTLAVMTRSSGWDLEVTRSVTPSFFIAIAYSTGQALVADGTSSASTASSHVVPVRSQAVMVAVNSRIVATGTGLTATYRWQPSRTITAVNPFGRLGDQPYLGLHLRQAVTCRGLLPPGMELTADATNLLAEGYRPVGLIGSQTAFLTQAPRALSAGVAIDF